MTGPSWLRDLELVGTIDAPIDQVRAAIETERRVANRPVRVRVVRAERVDATLHHVEVHSDDPLPEGAAWAFATIRRSLDDVGDTAPWRGEVFDVDGRNRTLMVDMGSTDDEPSLGDASVWPNDFLRAPFELVTNPRFAALHPAFRRALAAAEGAAAGARLHRAQPPGPWNASWGHVWGPPGTGKTWSLGQQVARLLSDPGERVLVVSTTHRATDAAALEIGRAARAIGRDLAGIRRVGCPSRIERFTEEQLDELLSDPDLLQEISTLRGVARAAPGADRARARRQLRQLALQVEGLTRATSDGDVTCAVSTLHAALGLVIAPEVADVLESGRAPFTTVVLDEAGLVGRAHVAALALLAARRVVVVGDPKQLSPIARASRTLPRDVLRWVASSALEHLDIERPSEHTQVLDTQHRMAPAIRAAVSELAYAGRLRDHAHVTSRLWKVSSPLRTGPRLRWYVLDDDPAISAIESASEAAVGGSRTRRGTWKALGALFGTWPELQRCDGLFVTPFRGQADHAQQWLRDRGYSSWSASTVHAQQGAEADVVVFDTVHASSTGWPPNEWVRLVNVGLSRAKELCVLIATRAEVDQPWMRPLRPLLYAGFVTHDATSARWRESEVALGRPSLFAASPADAPPPELPRGHTLGAQIARRRLAATILTAEQRALVGRDLSDAGPRLVRGVAGSGKTVVLAHWAVRVLRGLDVRTVTVVYGNRALRPLLERLVDDAWQSAEPVRPVPWDRLDLLHVEDLLNALEREVGLVGPADRYAYDARAARILPLVTGDRFDALLIDEAQDLGHATLQLLFGLVTPRNGARPVMVFYDNSQNLYGRSTPRWKDFGLDLRGRSDVLRESFRSTRPIVELALNLVHQIAPITDDADLAELRRPRNGPPLLDQDERGWWNARFCAGDGEQPAITLYDDEGAERAAVVEQVASWIRDDELHPGDLRILSPRKELGREVAQSLARAGIPSSFRTTEGYAASHDEVVVTTPHSFKGYDAEVVVVVGADHFVADRKVLTATLYVGLTRARTRLWVTGSRGRTSDVRLLRAIDTVRAMQRDRAAGGVQPRS